MAFPLRDLNLEAHVQGEDGPQRYDLYGIVNHYGALMGGHYTAYVRHAVTGDWQCFDDTRVTKASCCVAFTYTCGPGILGV